MPVSPTFRAELAATDELLGSVQTRLVSLRDYAEFDGLPAEVIRRLENKGRAVGVTRDSLVEIPKMVEDLEGRR